MERERNQSIAIIITNAIEHESEWRLWEFICKKREQRWFAMKNNAEKRARQEIVNPAEKVIAAFGISA